MKYFYCMLFSVIMLPFFSNAQSNYKPGYVINLKGDTIRGFIDYRDWSNNPVMIYFKKTLQDKQQKFDLNTIEYFAVDQITAYRKYNIFFSADNSSISSARDTSKAAPIFLRILQTGKYIALYSYVNSLRTGFYIGETPNFIPVELLSDNTQDNNATGSNPGSKLNTYMKQLYSLAIKYNLAPESINRDIENSTYNASSLVNIVKKINRSDDRTNQAYKKSYPAIIFYAGTGVSIITTASDKGTPYNLSGGKNNTSIFPKISLGLNVFANPVTRRLILATELGFSGNLYNVSYQNLYSPYGIFRYKFNQYDISISQQIIYNFYNKQSFRVFAGVGGSISFFEYGNKAFTSSNGTNSLAVSPFFFNNYNVNFLAKAGILINNKIEMYLNRLSNSDVSSDSDNYFFLHSSTTQIGINYHF